MNKRKKNIEILENSIKEKILKNLKYQVQIKKKNQFLKKIKLKIEKNKRECEDYEVQMVDKVKF